jgi:hypothetical protein
MLLVLSAFATTGCDAKVDVLTSSNGAKLQRSDGTWANWCAQSLDFSFDMVTFMAEAQQGLVCTEQNETMACGSALDSHGCGWDVRNCVGGHVQAVTTTTIGCSASGTTATTNTWSDCASALANGNSGDTCSWQGACSRTTDDPCCIEAAICTDYGVSQTVVQRNRICAPGCTGITADTSKAKVSTCTDAPAAIDAYAVPCDSSLACTRTGVSTFADIANADNANVINSPLYFCADGKVMFVPGPFATMIY